MLPEVLIDIISRYTNNNYDDISIDIYEKYIDRIDWDYLSGNENIPVSFFEKYIDKVRWPWLSKNGNIPKQYYRKATHEALLTIL